MLTQNTQTICQWSIMISKSTYGIYIKKITFYREDKRNEAHSLVRDWFQRNAASAVSQSEVRSPNDEGQLQRPASLQTSAYCKVFVPWQEGLGHEGYLVIRARAEYTIFKSFKEK